MRVIVTLDDPPLAAATFARRLPGFGADAKLNFSSSFSRSYLEQARGGAGERDRQHPRADPRGNRVAALPGARERVRRERPVRAAAGSPRGRGREPRLSELLVHAQPEPRAVGARHDRLLGADRRARRRRQGGRRRRRRRSRARVPRPHRLLVSRGLSEGNVRLDDPEGDRGPRLRGAGSEQHAARSRQLLPRHARRGRDRGRQDRRRGGADGHLRRVGRAAAIRQSTTSKASRPARTSATTGSSTSLLRRRSVAAARRTAPRSSPPSRQPCATGWTSSTSRAAGRRRILGRTCSFQAVANIVRAGVVPIISAGNDRDFFGLGTAGSPATAPDAISVGATANAHVFGPSITVRAPGGVARIPFGPADNIPPSWISTDQRLVDVGTIGGANRQLCDGTLAAGSLRNSIALVSRGGCPYSAKQARVARGGRRGHGRRREPSRRPDLRALLRASGRNHLRPRRSADPRRSRRERRCGDRPVLARDQRGADDLGRRADELLGRRTDAVRARAEARRHGAGRADPLVHASRVRRRPVRDPRRDELLRAAHRGRRGPPDPAAPVLDAGADEVGAHVDGRPFVRRHVAHAGGVGHRPGRGDGPRIHGRQAADLLRPAVPLLRIPRRRRGRELDDDSRDDLRRRRRRRNVDGRDSATGRVGGRDGRRAARHDRAGRQRGDADLRPRLRRGGAG